MGIEPSPARCVARSKHGSLARKGLAGSEPDPPKTKKTKTHKGLRRPLECAGALRSTTLLAPSWTNSERAVGDAWHMTWGRPVVRVLWASKGIEQRI